MATKKSHCFRVGDVVKRKDGKEGLYVVSGTKGWIHKAFTCENGQVDARISLTKEIGVISLLARASEYVLVRRREDVGKKWWLIFTEGEK